MMNRFWNDQAGFVISTELMIVATLLVLGMIAGLVSIRSQIVQELGDVAAAISEFDQTFSFAAITGHTSSMAGADFDDALDFCENAITDDPVGAEPICMELESPATEE